MKMMFSLFDTLLEPVFVLNSAQKVVYCNEAAALIVGQSVRKICRDQKITSLIQFSEEIEALEKLDRITESTPYKELHFKTDAVPDGKGQITLQPIFDALGDKNWVIYLRDVTLEERLQKKYRGELSQKEDVIAELKVAQEQLKEANKNLEQKIADRTAELTQMNSTLAALLDSLGQGFFIFDAEGNILPIFSKACLTILGTNPAQKKIWDVLNITEQKTASFKKWMLTVFQEMLPFEDLAVLGPQKLDHLSKKHVSLEYHPLRNQDRQIVGVVVVASDITSLIEAQQQAESQKENALMIVNIIRSKREVQRFIEEAYKSMVFIRSQVDGESVLEPEELYRHLHTLKGGAAMFAAQDLSKSCHEAETLLSEYRQSPSKANFVALRAKSLEIAESLQYFLKKTQEVLGKSVLSNERQIEVALSKLNSLAQKMGTLPGAGPLAQQFLLELAMEPASQFISVYNDPLQQLAQKLGKELAPLKIKGGDIMLMPEVYNKLFASLIHAFRNAVDHGIEMPTLRQERGKLKGGQIEVRFEIQENQPGKTLRVSIQDDGGGIDLDALKEKLGSQGFNLDHESDQETLQHIFDQDLSTKDIITPISGRGVGLDAIQKSAQDLGGKAWVESTEQQGTRIHIEVPYLTEVTSSKEPAQPVKKAA